MKSSKYSIKELAIAHSFPLGLRFILDQGTNGQTSTVKKLTSILFDRVNTHNVRYSIEKENFNQQKISQNFNRMAREKIKRVVSQKHQRSIKETKEKKQIIFLDLLNYNDQQKETQKNQFKPYRLHQSYKKPAQTESYPIIQSIDSRSSFTASKLKSIQKKNQSWKVQKWQTTQQSMNYSFLIKFQDKE